MRDEERIELYYRYGVLDWRSEQDLLEKKKMSNRAGAPAGRRTWFKGLLASIIHLAARRATL